MMRNPFKKYLAFNRWLVWKIKKGMGKITDTLFGYRIKIRIFRNTVTGYQEIEDTGKIVKKGKLGKIKRYLVIKGQRERIPIPKNEYFLIDERGKRRLLLYSPSRSTFYPIKPDFTNPKLKAIPEDILLWNALETERALTKYQSKSMFEKFLPIVLIGVTAIAIVLVTHATTTQMATITGQMGGIINALEGATQALEKATGNLANIPGG